MDTEDAGQGDVDVEVACGGQLLRTQREKLGPSSHRYSFVPIMAADHTIDITFNYEKVPGEQNERSNTTVMLRSWLQ